MEKKAAPIMPFNERFEIAKAIKYADIVVAQDTYSPLPNVVNMKVDVLMESTSHELEDLEEARHFMRKIGGEVMAIPYFPVQSSTDVKKEILNRFKG